MEKKLQIVLFLVFIWIIGLIAVLSGLKTEPIISILGISAPYYLTKFLLVESKKIDEE